MRSIAGATGCVGERSMIGLPSLPVLDSSQRVRMWLASAGRD